MIEWHEPLWMLPVADPGRACLAWFDIFSYIFCLYQLKIN